MQLDSVDGAHFSSVAVTVRSIAVSAPPAAQPLLTSPLPDVVAAQPAASLTGPSRSPQEQTE